MVCISTYGPGPRGNPLCHRTMTLSREGRGRKEKLGRKHSLTTRHKEVQCDWKSCRTFLKPGGLGKPGTVNSMSGQFPKQRYDVPTAGSPHISTISSLIL